MHSLSGKQNFPHKIICVSARETVDAKFQQTLSIQDMAANIALIQYNKVWGIYQ